MANHKTKTEVRENGRVCTKCLAFKYWSEYAISRIGTRGHRTDCKTCVLSRVDKGKMNAYRRARHLAFPWKSLHHGSKARGQEHTISEEDVRIAYEITNGHCPVEGCGKSFRLDGNRQGDRYSAPSLDRIDNNLGYVPGNIWVICFECNSIKRNYSPERLRGLAESIDRALTSESGDVIDRTVIR